MNGKRSFVHTVLRPCKLGQIRATSSQHRLADFLQAQTQTPVIVHKRVGATQQRVHRVVECTGQLLTAAAEDTPVQHCSWKPLNLKKVREKTNSTTCL